MASLERQLDRVNLSVNTGWPTRQFTVRNTTPYGIYFNMSGLTCTQTDYDFYIQPFSDYVSTECFATTISIFFPSVSFTNPPKVIFYSQKELEPHSTPYSSSTQVITNPDFPTTLILDEVRHNLIPFVYRKNTPSLVFSSAIPYYLGVQPISTPPIGYLNFVYAVADENLNVLGWFDDTGDVIYIKPKIPNTNHPLFIYDLDQVNQSVIVHLLSSENFYPDIAHKNTPVITQMPNVIGDFYIMYGVFPPSFTVDILLDTLQVSGDNYDFNVLIQSIDLEGVTEITEYNNRFTFVSTGNEHLTRLVAPFTITTAEFRFIRIKVSSLVFTNNGTLWVNITQN